MASIDEDQVQPLDDCFDLISTYISVETISNPSDLEKCLESVAVHASQDGLDDEQLEMLASFIIGKDLRVKSFALLVKCLVPRTIVPDRTVRTLLLYLLSHYNKIPPKASVCLLQWIIAMLEFELVDASVVDPFYKFFYFMLKFSDQVVHKFAAQVICMLSRPEDVNEEKIHLINSVQKQYNKKPYYLNALLSLFKCYRPELVPEKIPVMKMMPASACLTESTCKAFRSAQKRNSETDNGGRPDNWMKLFYTDTLKTDLMVKRKYTDQVLKTPEYPSNKGTSKRKITDIESAVELEECAGNVDLPLNVLCLLSTEAGRHYIAFGDADIQKRFAYKLNDTFNRAFLRRSMRASYEEKDVLLEHVAKLEDYMEQGIFVVSRFLASYLCYWNGHHHRPHILHLIKWLTFSSYPELRDRILVPLYELYITGDAEFKCEIIDSLIGLLCNMFVVDVGRFQKGMRPPFLGVQAEWVNDYRATLGPVINAIGHFATAGLLFEPDSNWILHKVIAVYNLIFSLEQNSKLMVMSIVPFMAVYRSLFSNNPAPLNRVVALLRSYRSAFYQMDPDMAVSKFATKIRYIESYVSDVMNCLWFGTALSNCEKGLLFKSINGPILAKLNEISNPDGSFTLVRHIMMTPYIVGIAQSAHKPIAQILSKKNVLEIMEDFCEELANLIKEVLESEKNQFISLCESEYEEEMDED